MDGIYDVCFGDKTVGRVQMKKEGLYYRFLCRCKLSGDVVCRLAVSCGDHQESLGVLVPVGDGFGLETKLPAKRLGQGKPGFCVLPNRNDIPGKFVPIYPEEPFAYIAKLKEAFLERKNGQLGVILKEQGK